MRVTIFILSVSILVFNSCGDKEIAPKPNVLFISIDDLRAELGAYGNKYVVSPNLDRLASEGSLFLNHYVNVPTCGASRYTLLTGMLPRSANEIGNNAIRDVISERVEKERPETFIHHLRRNNYYTVGIGKIGHYVDGLLYGYNDSAGTIRELPYSWDELHFDSGKWGTGWNAFFGYADGSNRQSKERLVKPYERGDVDDSGYPDGLTAALAIEKIDDLAKRNQPFFLAVGLFKPHLPFNSPSKYWNLYDEKSLPLTNSPSLPDSVNIESLHNSGEFNQYLLGEEKASLNNSLSDEYSRKLKHAYYACISYVDALVGDIISELKSQGLYDNTIVVVWGDHGWHLGDHLVWGKHTIFEDALKSTLIIKAPNAEPQIINNIVSTIDIYPTLMDMCGVDIPFNIDGNSVSSMIETGNSDIGSLAFSYYNRGISMRTDRYRISKYYREAEPVVELYDHLSDPYENVNIALLDSQLTDSLLVLLEKRGNTGLYNRNN